MEVINQLDKINLLQEKASKKDYIIILWSILISGAWIIPTENWFKIFIIFINIIYIFFNVIKTRFIPLNKSTILLIYVPFIFIINMLINNDLVNGMTYISLFITMLTAYYVTENINFDIYFKSYTQIMIIISSISLIFTLLNPIISQLNISLFPIVEGQSAVYRNMFIYLYPLAGDYRNTGIFWEPGAFQVFLNIALIYLLFNQNNKNIMFGISILISTILSTKSTQGYIVLVIILIAYIISQKQTKYNSLVTLGVLISLFLIFSNENILMNIQEKIIFFERSNSSLQRFHSTSADVFIILKNPFTGVGFTSYPSLLQKYGANIGYNIVVNANTITYTAAIFGIPLASFLVYGIYKFSRKYSNNMHSGILCFFAIIALFTAQNFMEKIIIYILIFYGLKNQKMMKSEK